ncbi:CD225/dispanin family protein [Chryseobacterium sp. MP_3.2]|uniref:CD225/dispanin family protein n=1 Tax=Chryseobacterium sp. MP_3.2 TaxID=3071712 RepID=UPI002DFB8172|nr:uncharacterized membrane protein YjgN (DUF898 family) [Chryseobacterium sp. MP_3.2]
MDQNQPQSFNNSASTIPPKSWLIESILVTVFCCQILGIISIIYAAGVESKFYRGDIYGAESASSTAKTLVIISAATGVLTIVGIIILAMMGVFAGLIHNYGF